MDKSMLLQKQIRDNSQDLHSFMSDMKSWEAEMKRKEAELTGVPYEKDLPPVRSKVKKSKSETKRPKPGKRIKGSDYSAWDKFDVDKACEEIDEEDVGAPTLDSEESQAERMEKLREEAQEEKEKGNQFVKQQKWDEAIACYSRAIELYKDDAIYYANRGLCHLKKENLHAAEADCTKALNLDSTYVKALHRRSSAREALGSLRSASADLKRIIELEPNNLAAKKQLVALTQKMGTKGPNSKMSPATTPTMENPPVLPMINKTAVSTKEPPKESPKISIIPDNDDDDDIIHPINKPPHLRSKKPLVRVPVTEIPLGCSKPLSQILDKSDIPTDKIVPENLRNGDCNVKSNTIDAGVPEVCVKESQKSLDNVEKCVESVNIRNLNIDEEEISYQIPKSSVQFLSQWKLLKGCDKARSQYLKLIPPQDLPSIFHFLESDILSEILHTLSNGDDFVTSDVGSALAYLENITKIKRFGALVMFLSSTDKEAITRILQHCVDFDKCSQSIVEQIKNKYELM